MSKNTAILLMTCPDQRGLVAGVSNFLLQHNANILHADQHLDADANLFLMRVEWDLNGFALNTDEFKKLFEALGSKAFHNLAFAAFWSAASSGNFLF